MKTNNFFITCIMILLASFMVLNICIAEVNQAVFIEPEKGKLIENRKTFPVKTQIYNYDANAHYWVAIASVKGHKNSWKRVLELRQELNDKSKKSQMLELISEWEINLVWPKYYIKKKVYTGRVYDGGVNPKSEPQPMILLILKVDSKLNSDINEWLDEGPETGYPGMKIEDIRDNLQILARCEIFFP